MKLTKNHRDLIIRNALIGGFEEAQAALAAKYDDLFERIFATFVPKAEREALAKVPNVWLNQTRHFYVNAGGWRVVFSLSKDYPTRWSYGDINLTDEKMIAEARALADARSDLEQRKRHAETALFQMLQQASSFERLKAAWPEGEEYWLPVWEAEKAYKLPAIDVASINQALGLPKSVAQAA